jgi:hypothetical protein
MPSNFRSARLLFGLQFQFEGLAKRYLCINGRWEDHILTSRLRSEAEMLLDHAVAKRCVALIEQRDAIRASTLFHWWPRPRARK